MKTRIRDLREDNDLTQEQVAQYLHVKQNTYSQYETEKRNIPNLIQLNMHCEEKL